MRLLATVALVARASFCQLPAAVAAHHAPGFLSLAECDALVAAAESAGLRSSLSAARALDPKRLQAGLARPFGSLDLDNDGVLGAAEVAAVARGVLNAPMLGIEDARQWLLAATARSNLSAAAFEGLRQEHQRFAVATSHFFGRLFEKEPAKFSRFSKQAPLPWQVLEQLEGINGTSLAGRVANLTGWPAEEVSAGEPLQVIRYDAGGHYAAHSDSGWPGHREISFLIYLEVPEAGGETCFLPGAPPMLPPDVGYAHRCAELLLAAGGDCPRVERGDALWWTNTWREEDGVATALDVPGAHAACPVRQGTKWVASGWLTRTAPCEDGAVCFSRAG